MKRLTEITTEMRVRSNRINEINARIDELGELKRSLEAEWVSLADDRTVVQGELTDLRTQLLSGFESAVAAHPEASEYAEIGASMDQRLDVS
jgi:DNA repair ATPase RecN